MPYATLAGRRIGPGEPALIIAELSGNHGGSLDRALQIVDAAAGAGVDAVKLQTYTADTLTIDADTEWFRVKGGTLWDGKTLHGLYAEAMTPWEWTGPLFERAAEHGMIAFSTPFDTSAVSFLEGFDPPAYKIASFEILDHDLLRAVGATGRPVLMSTGLAEMEEIDEAVAVLREAGTKNLVVLWCNSAYPADPAELHLRTIPDIAARWDVAVGLSDHTMGATSAIVAVALGACVIEKHVTLRRADGGPDADFSLEPHELADFVTGIRDAESSLGPVRYGPTPREARSLVFRRSLFFVKDIAAGSVIHDDDVRAIRPGQGLAPKHRLQIVGLRTRTDVVRGTPVSWELVEP